MEDALFEDVYLTLLGVMGAAYRVPGVENAFAPGSYCERRYGDMTRHRERLWERLNSPDDEDVEQILTAMESIQRELCRKMFEYGRRFP